MNDSGNVRGINDDLESTIQGLRRKGVRLWIENGALRYRAPKGAITADDISVLQHLDSTRLSTLALQKDERPFHPHVIGRASSKLAPLSFNQIAHLKLVGRPIRQVISVTRIEGTLHESVLTESLSLITERHDSLHTAITDSEDGMMQRVLDRTNYGVDVIDITHVPSHQSDNEIHRHIISAIVDVRDYSSDPLFKVVLLRLKQGESVLILAMDHMISDGVSCSILENEIFTTYEQLITGCKLCQPSVRMQYADYSIWQRKILADYFKTWDSPDPAWRHTVFPTDTPDQGRPGWESIRFTLDLNTRRKLEESARRRGTTLVMMVLTAYVALVLRWCQTSETLVQVMSDGRTSRMIENTIGYLAYPLYLYVSAGRESTFTELLDSVTIEYCQACERPNFYYSYTLSPRPEFTRNTSFNWRPGTSGTNGGQLARLDGGNRRSPVAFYDRALDSLVNIDAEPGIGFQDMGSEVAGLVSFPRSRFCSSTMIRFTENFRRILDAIVASPTIRIREIMMM